MAMKDMILKDVKVNDEIYVMVGMKELTGRVESIDEDIIRLSIDDTRIISVALESIGMYEVLNTAKTEESQPTDDEETAPVVEEEVTNPLGEAVILPLQMSFWSTSLDRLCLNDNIKTQCFNRNRDGLLFIGLSQIIDEIIVCTNENALGSIYGRTPKIAERLVALGNNYDFPAIPELLKILLITMDEYSQDVLGRDVKWADVYFADAYIAYKRGDHQKACGYLDRYLRLVPIRDKEIMTIMYFAQYARDPRYVKHPVFAKDVKNSFKKEDNIIRYNKAKDYIINHTSRAQSHRSDTSAVNDEDIYLTVPLTHWPRDISKIKARDVRQICKDNDPSGDFYNELTQIINKLSNGNRINELDLKYNRTQEIAAKIVAVHQRHPHLLLRELLMVLLLKVDEYSSRVIRSDPQFAEVYYADAYKAYLDNDVKRASLRESSHLLIVSPL